MKTKTIENIVEDQTSQRTYIVMADRILTDGELYSAIRIHLLQRGVRGPNGERVVINASKPLSSR